MKNHHSAWFAISKPDQPSLRCARCGRDIDVEFARADHHPRRCPACGTDCAFLAWGSRTVQIVPQGAPAALARLLRWAQQHLDELDYAEVIVAMEELAAAMCPAPAGEHPT